MRPHILKVMQEDEGKRNGMEESEMGEAIQKARRLAVAGAGTD